MNKQSGEPLQDERRFVTALRTALAGDTDQADKLLREPEESSLSAPAIDLLARIAYARGNEAEARRLWQLALARDGGCEPARVALATLNSPWRARALLKASGAAMGVLLLVVLAGIGVRSLVSAPESQPVEVTPAVAPLSATVVPEPEPWPTVDTARFEVQRGTEWLTLTPRNLLFTSRCEFAPTAAADVEAIARLIQNELRNCSVLLVGLTDSRTVRSDSAYRDNYHLGWQRAVTVASYLQRVHGVDARRLAGTSGGLVPVCGNPEVVLGKVSGGRTIVFRFERSH